MRNKMPLYNIICCKDGRNNQNWKWGIKALECKDRELKEPYKIYTGDIVMCSICDHKSLVLPKTPLVQEGMTGWEEHLEAFLKLEETKPEDAIRFY